MAPTFGTFLQTCSRGANQKASSENWKSSSEDLWVYAHTFLKHCAASLMDLPELHWCLWELHL